MYPRPWAAPCGPTGRRTQRVTGFMQELTSDGKSGGTQKVDFLGTCFGGAGLGHLWGRGFSITGFMQEMTSDGKPRRYRLFGGEGLGLNSWAMISFMGRRAPHHGVHARDDVRWSIWDKKPAVHPRTASPAAPFRGLFSRRRFLWRLRRTRRRGPGGFQEQLCTDGVRRAVRQRSCQRGCGYFLRPRLQGITEKNFLQCDPFPRSNARCDERASSLRCGAHASASLRQRSLSCSR